jgi:hypothetical protein
VRDLLKSLRIAAIDERISQARAGQTGDVLTAPKIAPKEPVAAAPVAQAAIPETAAPVAHADAGEASPPPAAAPASSEIVAA